MTSKELDPRVFEDYTLVIYDPDTFLVKEMLVDVPKGADLADIKTSKAGFSFGFYRGPMPDDYKQYRFINGELIQQHAPILFLEADTPFYIKDPAGFLVPLLLSQDSYTISIKSITREGRIFTHNTGSALRLECTHGSLSKDFIENHTGKSDVILDTKNTASYGVSMIKCESKRFGVIHLRMLLTSGAIKHDR
tara:strand:- start:1558 stop:2136 length:579 start_codon:yes stop_codon:yes gene_type:complete